MLRVSGLFSLYRWFQRLYSIWVIRCETLKKECVVATGAIREGFTHTCEGWGTGGVVNFLCMARSLDGNNVMLPVRSVLVAQGE